MDHCFTIFKQAFAWVSIADIAQQNMNGSVSYSDKYCHILMILINLIEIGSWLQKFIKPDWFHNTVHKYILLKNFEKISENKG